MPMLAYKWLWPPSVFTDLTPSVNFPANVCQWTSQVNYLSAKYVCLSTMESTVINNHRITSENRNFSDIFPVKVRNYVEVSNRNCLLCARGPCPWLGDAKVTHMIIICHTFAVIFETTSGNEIFIILFDDLNLFVFSYFCWNLKDLR